MKASQQNQRKIITESQIYTRKHSQLNAQNSDPAYSQSSRPRILQTISQQAFSEDKGSLSNRSQTAQNTNRIYKNLSERNINQHRSPQFKNYADQPIRAMKHMRNTFDYTNAQKRTYDLNAPQNKPPIHRINETYCPVKFKCYECPFYLNKIAQLQNSYELLLMAKNQELDECKMIIKGLEDKLKHIQKRNIQQIEKNKKFRSQMQRKNTDEHYHRERQNQMIEYLKNREIVLLEQMKELQNKIYVKDIKTQNNHSANKQKGSQKKLHFNSKGFSSVSNIGQFKTRNNKKENQMEFNDEHSISECSAKTFEQQFDINQNIQNENGQLQFLSGNGKFMSGKNELYSSSGTRMSIELIQRVPLNEILKKTNEIECLKDNLLVSELKIKIEQTKSLQNLLFSK